jgi:glycosyltransferase involved in cell wall biosynthesis
MGSGINKLRIVWICQFMNKDLEKRLFGGIHVKEGGPWISLGIQEISKRNDIELFVISPSFMLLKNAVIKEKNITYHFIKTGVPFLRREWPRLFRFDLWTDFNVFNIQVRRLVKKIKPDLVNLHGAENANYSTSIFHIHHYPVLITIQGFISLENDQNNKHPYLIKRLKVEKKILHEYKYFGIEANSIEKYIRSFNPDAVMYWFHYPFAKTEINDTPSKIYDLVYYARIVKSKGIEDIIKAVSLVKNQKPEIKLCIIGKGDDPYVESIKDLIKQLDLNENVVFTGFLPTQTDSHHEVVKARISVLPTYNDTIPGTIVECMLLGVPVISYRTGGIPDLNKEEEHIILVEQGNVEKLSEEIIDLLNNTYKQKELADKARKFAGIEFDNAHSVDLMIRAYRDLINKFRNEN